MDVETFTDFSAARKLADELGQAVGGTISESGDPVYFVHPVDASEDALSDLAFEVRNGRPMSDDERRLDALAKAEYPEVFGS